MGKMGIRKWTAAVIFFLITLVSAQAGSPVWKISNGSHTLYLGGTIHVLGGGDYPLPREFDTAYEKAQILVFETDIAKTQDPEFAKTIMGQMTYTKGKTLKGLIRPSTFDALSRFSTDRGIPVDSLNTFKPGMVMVFLTLAEMERLGAGGAGVDEYFFKRGRADHRPMIFLESPMDQIRFLADVGLGKEDEMISYIMEDIGKLPGLLPIMKQAWRSGDNDLMYRETLAPLKKEYPQLYQTIMVKRNLAWLPAIRKMLATPETEFILVGAAHLAGDQGLIALLRGRGFTAVNP